ncbi:MAG: putative membrane protein [Cyclobacteriaceae bacterium]|jgi:putative membrane protein
MHPVKNYKAISYLLIILHTVGAVGCMWEYSRPWMILLTPVNLILSAFLLSYAHQESKLKLALFFILTASIGFFIEVVGVKTGLIFGIYSYGDALGFKALDVPLTIGINWFMLTYLFGHIVSEIKINRFLKILLAAALMTAMDVLIEQIAFFLDYWQWENGEIPFQNYLGWFILSIVMQSIYQQFKFKKINPLTKSLLISQLIFFVSLLLFFL